MKHRRPIAFIVATVGAAAMWLLVGGAGLNARSQQQPFQLGAPIAAAQLPAWPAGVAAAADVTHDEDAELRNVAAYIVQAAMTEGGFDGVVRSLVSSDRNRIVRELGSGARERFADVDQEIALLRRTFTRRYGVDFEMATDGRIFGPEYALAVGAITDPATAVKQNLPPDGRVARFACPATLDLREVRLSLIQQRAHDWRLDLADDISAAALHDRLLANLTYLNQQPADHWPADVKQGKRAIAHTVLAALHGVGPADNPVTAPLQVTSAWPSRS